MTDDEKRDHTEKLVPLIMYGVKKHTEEIMDFVIASCPDFDDQIFMLKNLFLNIPCNVFKSASDNYESFIEKLTDFQKELTKYGELIKQDFDRKDCINLNHKKPH